MQHSLNWEQIVGITMKNDKCVALIFPKHRLNEHGALLSSLKKAPV